MIDKRLLDILVCPICKGDLHYDEQKEELMCNIDLLAFPIRHGMPVMLADEARQLSTNEVK